MSGLPKSQCCSSSICGNRLQTPEDKLLLSIALRLFPPHLDLKSFYVDVSRVHNKKKHCARSSGLPTDLVGWITSTLCNIQTRSPCRTTSTTSMENERMR